MDILITGGNGKLAKEIKNCDFKHNITFVSKEDLNLKYITNIEKIKEFSSDKKYDLILANANKYQGNDIENGNLTTQGLDITLGHSYLVTQLLEPPKYFVNLTTSLNYIDTHYYYRAHKTFNEDYFYRFFKSKYPDVKYFNIHPGHIDDLKNRKSAANLLLKFFDNIHQYEHLNYDFNHNENTIEKHENKTLSWE